MAAGGGVADGAEMWTPTFAAMFQSYSLGAVRVATELQITLAILRPGGVTQPTAV